jgi:hypothetical protein
MPNITLRLRPTALAQLLALLKQLPRLEGMPAKPTVALPVLLNPLALPPPVRRLLKHMPKEVLVPKEVLAGGSGTRPRVRISAATSASRTSIQRAATASGVRARSERHPRAQF